MKSERDARLDGPGSLRWLGGGAPVSGAVSISGAVGEFGKVYPGPQLTVQPDECTSGREADGGEKQI